MYYPTLDELKQLRDKEMGEAVGISAGDVPRPLVPLCRDILADMETPVSAYCKTAQGPYSFLLESVAGGERIARYSFIGIDPYMVMTHRGETATLRSMPTAQGESMSVEEIACHDPLEFIQAELGQYRLVTPVGMTHDELPRFHGGAVGYLSYEAVARFEQLPVPVKDALGLPLAVFCFTETVLVFDHLKHRVRIVTHLHLDAPNLEAEYQRGLAILDDVQQRLRQTPRFPEEPAPISDADALQVVSNRTRSEFEEMVRQAQAYIRAGDIFQVVLSQRLTVPVRVPPFEVYRALRVVNPSPYMYFLRLGDATILGSSPEMLVKVTGRDIEYRPIAGTRPRGRTEEEDKRLEEELRASEKERAEHIMLVDLGRNDVGRVSEFSSVRPKEIMFVERYSHVMHLVSSIQGRLRADADSYAALAACFPAGTLTGAPKVRAMEIIDELEPTRRGLYGGSVLYLDFSGNLNSCIVIRTVLVKDDRAYLQAGAGIVADSVPALEYEEAMNKAKAMLKAFEMAERGL